MAELRLKLILAMKILMLLYGPLILFVAVISVAAPFVEQVTLLQAIGFPVLACILAIVIVGVVLRLSESMHPLWFFMGCLIHMFMGVTSIGEKDVYVQLLMVILLMYSFWELLIVTRRFPTTSAGPS